MRKRIRSSVEKDDLSDMNISDEMKSKIIKQREKEKNMKAVYIGLRTWLIVDKDKDATKDFKEEKRKEIFGL